MLPGFLSTPGHGGEYLPCCCAYNPYKVARQFGFDLVNPTIGVAFPEGTSFDDLCDQFVYPKYKTIHPSIVEVIVPKSENIPLISKEWAIYWHKIVTMFKELKDALVVQLVAQPLLVNESVLKFIEKNEAKAEKPTLPQ